MSWFVCKHIIMVVAVHSRLGGIHFSYLPFLSLEYTVYDGICVNKKEHQSWGAKSISHCSMYSIVSPTVRFVEDAICQLRQVLLGLNKVPFMHRFSPNLNEYLECTHHRMWNLNCTCITIQSMLNQINLDYIQSVFNQLKLLYTVSQLNLYFIQ